MLEYKRSLKVFKEFVKKNPNMKREEWDQYAQDNCLFSAQTLMFHFFHTDLIKYLNRKQIDRFEYLKDMFLFVPVKYRDNKIFSTFLKIQNNTKEKIAGGYTNDR